MCGQLGDAPETNHCTIFTGIVQTPLRAKHKTTASPSCHQYQEAKFNKCLQIEPVQGRDHRLPRGRGSWDHSTICQNTTSRHLWAPNLEVNFTFHKTVADFQLTFEFIWNKRNSPLQGLGIPAENVKRPRVCTKICLTCPTPFPLGGLSVCEGLT